MSRILHLSDLHFGWPAVPEQVDAVELLAQSEHFDVIAVSGDLAQRARAGEFQRAAVLLRDLVRPPRGSGRRALIVVPGNHDVAWWFAPLGVGRRDLLYAKYKRYICEDLEPVVRVPGATFVGLNTAAGIDWQTLTLNPRDLSITGALRLDQLESAADRFRGAPPGDARVVVMHHNPLRGDLSQRVGLVRSSRAMSAFAAMGVDLILCGHDHQEAIHGPDRTPNSPVVVTAGTVSCRSRGGRPSSLNIVTLTQTAIEVETQVWNASLSRFEPGVRRCFER